MAEERVERSLKPKDQEVTARMCLIRKDKEATPMISQQRGNIYTPIRNGNCTKTEVLPFSKSWYCGSKWKGKQTARDNRENNSITLYICGRENVGSYNTCGCSSDAPKSLFYRSLELSVFSKQNFVDLKQNK